MIGDHYIGCMTIVVISLQLKGKIGEGEGLPLNQIFIRENSGSLAGRTTQKKRKYMSKLLEI